MQKNNLSHTSHNNSTSIERKPKEIEFFTAKAGGGLRLEGELRALVARVKYRGATR